MLSEHKTAVIKKYIYVFCACLCGVNKQVLSESILQSDCHRDPILIGSKHTCFLLERKTATAAVAGLWCAGCLKVGRCDSVSELVAEKCLAHSKTNCTSCRSPYCRVTPGLSRSLVGSKAHCGQALHKGHLSGILHQLSINPLRNECRNILVLFSGVHVFQILKD